MKNKKRMIVLIIISFLLLGLVLFKLIKSDKYEIKIKSIDEYSPDVELIVMKNGKEFTDYNYIKYKKDDVIICYSKNPVANKYELEDELIIVLNNDKEVEAKVVKE